MQDGERGKTGSENPNAWKWRIHVERAPHMSDGETLGKSVL